MSNISQEEESQDSIHQQPLHGGFELSTTAGDPVASTNTKRRRSLPGNPDPDAEVIALSPRSLLATNRYVCEVCHKGFQRDQNLQLHRRGHNLPWKLKQRTTAEVKKRVYICPEVSCIHHDPSRALGDLTGIKKHFSRKHGEKKWKCDKCSKKYAVQSDWKAHSKICGTKEYRCDCGTIFSRRDSFVTHRAFCDALADQNYKANHGLATMVGSLQHSQAEEEQLPANWMATSDPCSNASDAAMMSSSVSSCLNMNNHPLRSLSLNSFASSSGAGCDPVFNPSRSSRAPSCLQLGGMNMTCFSGSAGNEPDNNVHMAGSSSYMSATALLQKAAEMGAKLSNDDDSISPVIFRGFTAGSYSTSMIRPFESVHEPSHDHANISPRFLRGSSESLAAAHNVGLISAATDGSSYMGNQNAFGMNLKWPGNVDTDLSPPRPTFPQADGILNSPPVMRSENRRNSAVFLEEGIQRSIQEEVAAAATGRVNRRTTQDFLGLGPVGQLSMGDQICHENEVGLRYSDGQQQEEHDVHSYQHISDQDQTALDKSMWNY